MIFPRVAYYAIAATLLLACIVENLWAQEGFFLLTGDTVVFYGDSITDRGTYTTFIEAYVATRFPKLTVRFVNSGWSGDTIAGGEGGSLEARLRRDVIRYRPTVVTVLLGMNDGHYRPLSEHGARNFRSGYEKLIRTVKTNLPNVRLTLLEPSPFDEVTRPNLFPGGYNGVLRKFGQTIVAMGEQNGAIVSGLNGAVNEALSVVNAKDPSAAKEFIPDRVHPGPAASLLMAEAVLKSWHAPAIVTEVEIDAQSVTASRAVNSEVVSLLRNGDALSWTQNDAALPFPVDWRDGPVSVAAYNSDFIPAIDDQPLRILNLRPGDYTLRIDGRAIVTYSADQFRRGINLSQLETPMLQQAAEVLKLTYEKHEIHRSRWRIVEVPLARYGLSHYRSALASLDALEQEAAERAHMAAQPRSHRYEITRKNSMDSD